MKAFGTGQGYLKAGFLGFPKSGKTWTAMLLAVGLRKHFNLEKPIAMFDTEGGAEYIAPEVQKLTGQPLIGESSRSFDAMMKMANEVNKEASVWIVDSVTHVWRNVCDSFMEQINASLQARNLPKRSRLEFQDWNVIKPYFARWTDFYLNSPTHIIICGRAGFDWDFEEDEETGKKELIKTGVKMKVESEFGFEPSLLVQMERIQKRSAGNLVPGLTHRATVLGDRFNQIDGQSKDNPTFKFFLPHVKMLTQGAHAPVADGQSDLGIDETGQAEWQKEKKLRTILCEEIQGELLGAFPSQKVDDRKARNEMLKQAFATHSWTAVEAMPSADLKRGLAEIREAIHNLPSEPVES